MNLISQKTEVDADLIHFADCLIGGQLLLGNTDVSIIYDLGSGNGFPGVILAILAPEREIVMVEKDARKAQFIKTICSRLNLVNAEIIHGPIDSLDPGSVDCAVSRALGSIPRCMLLARKACSDRAEYYHFKGDTWVREVAEIPSQLWRYWAPKLVEEYELPDSEIKHSLVVTKRVD